MRYKFLWRIIAGHVRTLAGAHEDWLKRIAIGLPSADVGLSPATYGSSFTVGSTFLADGGFTASI